MEGSGADEPSGALCPSKRPHPIPRRFQPGIAPWIRRHDGGHRDRGPDYSLGMKRIVALVAAAGILGLSWCLLRPATRPARAVVSPPSAPKAYEPEDELVEQRLAPLPLPLREAEPAAQR